MNDIPYQITENSISVLVGGDQFSIGSEHKLFGAIRDAIRAKEWDKLPDLIDQAKAVRNFIAGTDGQLTLEGGTIYYAGEALSGFAVDYVLRMKNDGFDVQPLLNYLERLQKNPSMRNRQDQFEWLQNGKMPISADGYIIAFKKVRDDYKDCHSGTFDNSVGQIVEMPRQKVNDDIEQTCSYGLHFCSREYLPHFGGSRVMILKIDPADIVAFPRDYNTSKGRCCKYEVIGEVTNPDHTCADDLNEAVFGADVSKVTREDLIEDYGLYGTHDEFNRGDHAQALAGGYTSAVDYWTWVAAQINN